MCRGVDHYIGRVPKRCSSSGEKLRLCSWPRIPIVGKPVTPRPESGHGLVRSDLRLVQSELSFREHTLRNGRIVGAVRPVGLPWLACYPVLVLKAR